MVKQFLIPARYISSKRGANLLLFNGYIYRIQSKENKEGLKWWYCTMYNKNKCPSAVGTNAMDHIIQIRGDHNHRPPKIKDTPEGTTYEHPGFKRKHKKLKYIKNYSF